MVIRHALSARLLVCLVAALLLVLPSTALARGVKAPSRSFAKPATKPSGSNAKPRRGKKKPARTFPPAMMMVSTKQVSELAVALASRLGFHPIVLQVARSSHERMDGKGYPDGMVSEQIPLPARIVLVADAFDALTSDRPYRSARSVPGAMEELRAHSGTQFCPTVTAALDALYREEPQVLGAAALRAVGEAAA